MGSVVIDGVTHEVFDVAYRTTVCGLGFPALIFPMANDAVTCIMCLNPEVTSNCGHEGAALRNCPGYSDLRGDLAQRCRCCDICHFDCEQDL